MSAVTVIDKIQEKAAAEAAAIRKNAEEKALAAAKQFYPKQRQKQKTSSAVRKNRQSVWLPPRNSRVASRQEFPI